MAGLMAANVAFVGVMIASKSPLFRMDSTVNIMVECAIKASSLQQWLEAWADGKPFFHLEWKRATKVAVSHLGKAF